MITVEVVQDFFKDLDQKGDFDYSLPLLWGYFFLSADVSNLKNLGENLQQSGYRLVDVFEAELEEGSDIQEYYLHLEKVEKHNPKSLIHRNNEFYSIAEKYDVEYDGFDVGHLGTPPEELAK